MHTQSTAAAVGEDLEISAGLRSLHHSERVPLAGNGHIDGVVARDLQKYAAVGAAFVRLAGRMQKTRAEAEARRDVFGIANGVAKLLQLGFVSVVHLNVPEQTKVVACANPAEMGAEIFGHRLSSAQCSSA